MSMVALRMRSRQGRAALEAQRASGVQRKLVRRARVKRVRIRVGVRVRVVSATQADS